MGVSVGSGAGPGASAYAVSIMSGPGVAAVVYFGVSMVTRRSGVVHSVASVA